MNAYLPLAVLDDDELDIIGAELQNLPHCYEAPRIAAWALWQALQIVQERRRRLELFAFLEHDVSCND